MNVDIARNIRAYRKERKLTQERLAEVLGVTVGAVSKWESGASVPDVSLILDMAGFFETSVDALLGYEKRDGSLRRALERIKELRNQKDFGAASAEAEKTLIKYPNNFDAAFFSAVMYAMKGMEYKDNKAYARALELFDRALALIAQNTDIEISEWTIRRHIAQVKAGMGRTDEALEELKRSNAGGLNNAAIGSALAENRPDEALPYLSNALIEHVSQLMMTSFGFFNAYCATMEYAAALDELNWMAGVIDGLCVPGRVSHFDKEVAELLTACVVTAARMGDQDGARGFYDRALARAEVYDAAPANDFVHSKFYHAQKRIMAFDDFGATAREGVRESMKKDEYANLLLAQWEAAR